MNENVRETCFIDGYTWLESWTERSVGTDFTAIFNPKPVEIVIDPGSRCCSYVGAALVLRRQVDLSDERVVIATSSTA